MFNKLYKRDKVLIFRNIFIVLCRSSSTGDAESSVILRVVNAWPVSVRYLGDGEFSLFPSNIL